MQSILYGVSPVWLGTRVRGLRDPRLGSQLVKAIGSDCMHVVHLDCWRTGISNEFEPAAMAIS